jgi:hypothetical protein
MLKKLSSFASNQKGAVQLERRQAQTLDGRLLTGRELPPAFVKPLTAKRSQNIVR